MIRRRATAPKRASSRSQVPVAATLTAPTAASMKPIPDRANRTRSGTYTAGPGPSPRTVSTV